MEILELILGGIFGIFLGFGIGKYLLDIKLFSNKNQLKSLKTICQGK